MKGKGVIFTQSVKNTLKQQCGCRFSDCYRLFIGPIAKKGEVQSFLDKSGIEVKLIDIFADLEKGQKIEGLQTRLSILDEETHALFKEFIIQSHQYDRTRPYQDFEVEPSPHDPAKPNDDLRFRIENCLYDSAVKRKNFEKERENLQRSLDLHLQEDVELQIKGRLEGTKDSLKEFIFVKASNLEISPPKWIVEDYLEENSLAQIFGDPASGKTFIALDLAASIATGKSWMGKEVKKGVVFYIAGEGHNGLSRRLKAWSEYHKLVVEDLYISKQPAQFMDENHARTVSEAIRNLSPAGKPTLIVIDTLARNFGGGDENKTQDMNKFIFSIDVHIRMPFSCCVLIVHHTGHNDKDRARGAMALKGALDAEYCVRKKNELISMTATKMKDSELPPTISFRLSPISIGILDHKGKNIHSIILEPQSCVNDAYLEKIKTLIPETGINQGDLIVKIKGGLADMSNKKAQDLLGEGLTTHWNIEKGDNNASIYKPFFGFPTHKDQETENR